VSNNKLSTIVKEVYKNQELGTQEYLELKEIIKNILLKIKEDKDL